jgi:hypothetical protein
VDLQLHSLTPSLPTSEQYSEIPNRGNGPPILHNHMHITDYLPEITSFTYTYAYILRPALHNNKISRPYLSSDSESPSAVIFPALLPPSPFRYTVFRFFLNYFKKTKYGHNRNKAGTILDNGVTRNIIMSIERMR